MSLYQARSSEMAVSACARQRPPLARLASRALLNCLYPQIFIFIVYSPAVCPHNIQPCVALQTLQSIMHAAVRSAQARVRLSTALGCPPLLQAPPVPSTAFNFAQCPRLPCRKYPRRRRSRPGDHRQSNEPIPGSRRVPAAARCRTSTFTIEHQHSDGITNLQADIVLLHADRHGRVQTNDSPAAQLQPQVTARSRPHLHFQNETEGTHIRSVPPNVPTEVGPTARSRCY